MGKKARRTAVGAGSLLAAGALAAGISKYEKGGDSGVPVRDPKAHVTLRIGHPLTFNIVKRNGETDYVRERDPGTPINIRETKDGGLKAASKIGGNAISMNLELPMHGPNAANPDLTPDSSEPVIHYTLPSDREFWNSTDVNGHTVYFRDFGGAPEYPLTIQQDGHGGLIALNEYGDPVQVNIHLPAPGPDDGQASPHHKAH